MKSRTSSYSGAIAYIHILKDVNGEGGGWGSVLR